MRLVASLLIGLLVSAVAFASVARADTITIDLATEFSGAYESSGAPRITFTDAGYDTVTVTFDLTALMADGGEFASRWFFNSAIDPTSFSFTPGDGPDAKSIDTTFNAQECKYKADGDGYFDVVFTFESGAFAAGEVVVYTITGTGTTPITASTFDLGSLPGGGNGSWTSAVHIQGIGEDGANSGWMGGDPVPEPGTIILVGAAGVAFLGHRRRARLRVD